jgi:hypothetical protein
MQVDETTTRTGKQTTRDLDDKPGPCLAESFFVWWNGHQDITCNPIP